MDSLYKQNRREQPSECCFEFTPGGHLARPCEKRHLEVEHVNPPNKGNHADSQQPHSVGDWLRLCGVDLYGNEIRWPLDKLNELPDLRAQPKEIYDQCVAWHIFRDDRAVRFPSFENIVLKLDAERCSDAWFLEKPIKLKEDGFTDFKVQLSEGKVSKMRPSNVKVTERMLTPESQQRHLIMVCDKVREFYGVQDDHHIEIHNATADRQYNLPRHSDRDTPRQ